MSPAAALSAAVGSTPGAHASSQPAGRLAEPQGDAARGPNAEGSTPAGANLQATVAALARDQGFAHAGIAALPEAEEAAERRAYLEDWIAQGRAGEMDYLKRRDQGGELLRSSVANVAPWARSVIVCMAPYGEAASPRSIDPAPAGTGWIGRYAWSGTREPAGSLRPADYHKVLLARLKRLEDALAVRFAAGAPPNSDGRQADSAAPLRTWAWVDTGPVIEREWAARAGVGWTGKNACTLNQQFGSFFFLGVILTSLPVPPEARATLAEDLCGTCRRCLDACPTDALIAPRQMDASRCIAYLTIEKRGSIPEELRPGIGRNLFGCDICQEVCPWNAKASRGPVVGTASDPELSPRPELVNPSLAELAQLTEAEFGARFFGSPVKRAKYSGLRRNLAIAMGNSGDPAFAPQLRAWAASEQPDEVLRETAAWALGRLRV